MSVNTSLAKTGFFRLCVAEAISYAGAQLSVFALPLVAALSLQAGAWEMSLLVAAGSAADLVLGLSTGVWADRYERTRLMHIANMGRLLILVALPVLWWADMLTVWILAVAAFVLGALSLLFQSALVPYLPRLVGKEHIGRANSWLEGTQSASEVAGPGLAGVIVQVLGPPVALLVDAATYVVSSVSLLRLPKAPPNRAEGEGKPHVAEIREGLRLLRRDRYQWPLALASTHFNLFCSMFAALYVLFAVRVVGLSPLLLGVMTAIGGVAGLVAAALSGRITDRIGHGPTLVLSYVLPGLTALPVGLTHLMPLPYALVLIGISQFTWAYSIVTMQISIGTVRQTLVPDAVLGRITASVRFMSWGIMPLGALLGGALAETSVGLGGTLVISSTGMCFAALWPLLSSVRKLRSLTGEEGGADREAPVSDTAASP
ncbi:MFS transporter [Actinoplanes sp. CA-252034]|uniref:MFS transporter n=1 Tax=Actinoplanes sp. CA-252034 TaxID=3239906 RepID=UPI003D97439F